MTTPPSNWSYAEAFDRNRGLIDDLNQEKIRAAHIAIAGLGGVGGIHATTLARLGVGNFTIADPDQFEAPNTNRQQGASHSTFGKNKREVMESMIKDINPTATVRVFEAITQENIDDFLSGVSIALDGIDFFTIGARRLLYRECRARGIPVLSAGPIGFGGAMVNINPNGMSFEEYYDIHDAMSEREQIVQFALGLTPRLLQRAYFAPKTIDFSGRRAPSSVLGTLASANLIGCEVYKIIIGMPYASAPISWHFDPYVRKFRRCNLIGGNRNPIQRLKKWYFTRTLSLELK